MGQGASSHDGREEVTEGFRVLNVQPNSPAADVIVFPDASAARDGLRSPVHTALTSFLDFIVSCNGEPLTGEDSEFFAEEIRANVGQPVILQVYNVKVQKMRTVQVMPRDDWGGEGLLGLHVKWDSVVRAAESVLHVTDVEPSSPAEACGLVPGDDYILGSVEGAFESVDEFGDFVVYQASLRHQQHDTEGGEGRSGGGTRARDGDSPLLRASAISLYVLRGSTDSVRQVHLSLEHAERPWGGHGGGGGMGLTLAYGHMHQLPNRFTPGRNEFEVELEQQQQQQPGGGGLLSARSSTSAAPSTARSGGGISASMGHGPPLPPSYSALSLPRALHYPPYSYAASSGSEAGSASSVGGGLGSGRSESGGTPRSTGSSGAAGLSPTMAAMMPMHAPGVASLGPAWAGDGGAGGYGGYPQSGVGSVGSGVAQQQQQQHAPPLPPADAVAYEYHAQSYELQPQPQVAQASSLAQFATLGLGGDDGGAGLGAAPTNGFPSAGRTMAAPRAPSLTMYGGRSDPGPRRVAWASQSSHAGHSASDSAPATSAPLNSAHQGRDETRGSAHTGPSLPSAASVATAEGGGLGTGRSSGSARYSSASASAGGGEGVAASLVLGPPPAAAPAHAAAAPAAGPVSSAPPGGSRSRVSYQASYQLYQGASAVTATAGGGQSAGVGKGGEGDTSGSLSYRSFGGGAGTASGPSSGANTARTVASHSSTPHLTSATTVLATPSSFSLTSSQPSSAPLTQHVNGSDAPSLPVPAALAGIVQIPEAASSVVTGAGAGAMSQPPVAAPFTAATAVGASTTEPGASVTRPDEKAAAVTLLSDKQQDSASLTPLPPSGNADAPPTALFLSAPPISATLGAPPLIAPISAATSSITARSRHMYPSYAVPPSAFGGGPPNPASAAKAQAGPGIPIGPPHSVVNGPFRIAAPQPPPMTPRDVSVTQGVPENG